MDKPVVADYIGSSIQELDAGPDAPKTAAVLKRLKDIDANRIAKDDAVVMHKAVLALLAVVSNLESRIVSLEEAGARNRGV